MFEMKRKQKTRAYRMGLHDGYAVAFCFEDKHLRYPDRDYTDGYETGFQQGLSDKEAELEEESKRSV